MNAYRTADGRYLYLSGVMTQGAFAALCAAIGREDLAADPRFAGAEGVLANARACIAELDAVFAARPLAFWAEALGRPPDPVDGRAFGRRSRIRPAGTGQRLPRLRRRPVRRLPVGAEPRPVRRHPPHLTRAPGTRRARRCHSERTRPRVGGGRASESGGGSAVRSPPHCAI
ncbi:CoA transferase [Yinghuangia aomiensis]